VGLEELRAVRGLLPIQVGDDPVGPDGPRMMNQMGRGALRVTVRASNRDVRVLTAHLKSKLLTFPGGSFTPADEDQRARFASYALYRRASEATTVRAHLDGLLEGGGRDMAVILTGDMNDEVDAATTLILNGPPGSEIGSVVPQTRSFAGGQLRKHRPGRSYSGRAVLVVSVLTRLLTRSRPKPREPGASGDVL
jgi:hypothetical protein